MKQFNNLKIKINNKVTVAVSTIAVSLMNYPVCAQSQQKRLVKATNALNEIQTELQAIVPIAATVILIGLAIGYAGRFIEKNTFVRWGIGVVIAGSALQITSMLYKG
ncbi:VirB2 family type IV secretion system major pilin TrwL [Bartonella sp. F02]|uniref:VirB2 family type IV secretion system major pilin TrwL n=1 Tax=Bartonella sp. F02 TaxID=2967262 RepID=UPI0022A96A19|nr:VirB2 family type IV secretion system major pilin TrwL [Bartonella sp. F02]MCZ2328772.1 VirB2 family type IV secretion system major pilin TrwL [Bartonella sp. F02]